MRVRPRWGEGPWRALFPPGVPAYAVAIGLGLQALLLYIATIRGLGYLLQTAKYPPRGSFFSTAAVEAGTTTLWAWLLLTGVFLVLVHVALCLPVLAAIGHGLIGIVYLALGWGVLMYNPLNGTQFAIGLMNLVLVAGIGSSMGAARGAARQQGGSMWTPPSQSHSSAARSRWRSSS